MPWSDLDDGPPAYPWNPAGAPPTRDLRAVLADAAPLADPTGRFYWLASAPDWVGVDPPAGVLPLPMARALWAMCGRTPFETRAGAVAAVHVLVIRVEMGRLALCE